MKKMREKPLWLCILIIITLGAVKAHIHMLRMLIMAAAGLAGLYMLHLLAQDFQKIRQSFGRSAGLNTILKTSGIGKRSTSDWLSERLANETEEMKEILKNDPIGCARKYVCHISKYSKQKLKRTQSNVLTLLRAFAWLDFGGEWKKAEELGHKEGSKGACEKMYNKCIYSGPELENFVNFMD